MGYANAMTITACGRVCMHRKGINVSHVLAGQRVGIKEVDEGIWIEEVAIVQRVSQVGSPALCSTISRCIDLEQRTLQPVHNPFGSRWSPMS